MCVRMYVYICEIALKNRIIRQTNRGEEKRSRKIKGTQEEKTECKKQRKKQTDGHNTIIIWD